MARLMNGGELAHNVLPFCIVAAILAGSIPVIHELFPKVGEWMPSGIAFAVSIDQCFL